MSGKKAFGGVLGANPMGDLHTDNHVESSPDSVMHGHKKSVIVSAMTRMSPST